MAEHTPGPWMAAWSKYQDGVFIVQAGQPSNRVLAKFDGDGDGPDQQSIADAHLIAAAPDVLAALKAAANSAGFQYMVAETRDLIDGAIAKAEGRS